MLRLPVRGRRRKGLSWVPGRLARPVLRGRSGGNTAPLLDLCKNPLPPLPPNGMTVAPGCFDEPWREGVYPVVDGARVDRDTPLGKPLRYVGIAEAEAQVPANAQSDDLVGEVVAADGGRRPRGDPAAALGALVELPAVPITAGLRERLTP